MASTAANVIGGAPLAPALVRWAAVAPVRWKTPAFERIMSALAARASDPATLIETNGGISDDLRLEVPLAKHRLLFGRPQDDPAERATLALTLQLVKSSKAFLDIGANEGLFTLAVGGARREPLEAGIHAFEPDPVVFARLAANLARNRVTANLNLAAVGDVPGVATFHRNLSDDSSGSLTRHFAEQHRTEPIDVEVVTLSDYLEAGDIRQACLKVDVEGAGVAVWQGLGCPAFERVSWLIMEIIGPEAEAQLPCRIVEKTGCSAYCIRDFELVHAPRGASPYVAPFYNWLFCRASPDELAERTAAAGFRVVEEVAP